VVLRWCPPFSARLRSRSTAGSVVKGLTPALSISVESSGMAPPFRAKLEPVPAVESGEAVPDVVPLIDAQAEPNPPPSNTEPATDVDAMPDPLDAVIPEYEDPLVLQFETGAGLSPPGLISVAPSGIPVPLFARLEMPKPSIPSVEVTPVPVELIKFWACAAPQPTRTAATIRIKTLMELLLRYLKVALLNQRFLRRALLVKTYSALGA
jgi:hypothetical protein